MLKTPCRQTQVCVSIVAAAGSSGKVLFDDIPFYYTPTVNNGI